MNSTNEVIEWKFPPKLRTTLMRILGAILLATILFLVFGNLSMIGTRRAGEFQIVSLVAVGLLSFTIIASARRLRAAERATFYADNLGLHGRPAFDFKWNELTLVKREYGTFTNTVFVKLYARNFLRTQVLGIDSTSVDVAQLIEFANRKIAEAAPSA